MSVDLEIIKPSALGGAGWAPRVGSLRDDKHTIWAGFGAFSECGTLRAVLLHRPGPEVDAVLDPRSALFLERVDGARAREQHDQLADLYRAHGVIVHYVETERATPNLYFMQDTFAMTPDGAMLSRPASRVRAGEERIAARALAHIGVPIVLSVHGTGTFEGADLKILNEDVALIGLGLRTNRVGAQQVAHVLQSIGFREVINVELNENCLHLDCALSIVGRNVALIDLERIAPMTYEILRRHGFRIVEMPNRREADTGMAINMVALAPGLVVMPAGNFRTKHALEAAGIECLELEISELMKGGGAIHCMTGVVQRDAA